MSVLIETMADAFTTVAIYVAALFVLFGWARVRWGGRFERWLSEQRDAGPALAVVATLPPGCIGVLAICRLHVRGTVSYGTTIAALVSTLGDSAWLLLAKDPALAVCLKLGAAGIGLAVGSAVDHWGLKPPAEPPGEHLAMAGTQGASTAVGHRCGPESRGRVHAAAADGHGPQRPWKRRSAEGPAFPSVLSTASSLALALVFWVCVAFSLLLTSARVIGLVPESAAEPLAVHLGTVGALVAIALVLLTTGRLNCGEEGNDVETSIVEVARNGTRESAFVATWVVVVFVGWELVVAHGWLNPSAMPFDGATGVFIAAAAGLIPACGVEVAMSALYLTGAVPLPALVAYLLSQDGNGFIPLAARLPRTAIHAAILTTLPALAVGMALLLMV